MVIPFPGFVVVTGRATVDEEEVEVVTTTVLELEVKAEDTPVVLEVEVDEGPGEGSESSMASTQYDLPTCKVQPEVLASDGF